MVMNQGAFRDMLSSVRGEERAKALDVDLPPQFGRAHGSNLRVALVGRTRGVPDRVQRVMLHHRQGGARSGAPRSNPNEGGCNSCPSNIDPSLDSTRP